MQNTTFTRRLKSLPLVALLALALPILTAAEQVQPSAAEQVLLERINRARVQQADERRRLNLDFQEGMTYQVRAQLQPLVWRAGLQLAAGDHNRDMLTRGYYAHVSPDGAAPFDQVRVHDDQFLAVGQDLGAGRMYASPDAVYNGWMIDAGIHGRGHRQIILHHAVDSFGAASADNPNTFYGVYWTANFGVSLNPTPHVTGVIYRDWNGNGQYDDGEGLNGWQVRVVVQSPAPADAEHTANAYAGVAYATAADTADEPAFEPAYVTGGYALPVTVEGDYTVEALAPSGEVFYQTVGVTDVNVKVDFVIGAAPTTGTAATTETSGSGKKTGCTIAGAGSTAWQFLAGMGLLFALMLGLRVGKN